MSTPLNQPNSDAALTIWEHIVALKRVVFIAVGSLLLSASLVHWQREIIINFLLVPLGPGGPVLQFLSPLDPLYFILKIDFTLGFLIILPLLLTLLWRYVSPAMSVRWWIPLLIINVASALALLAAAYAYYLVTPLILGFMASIIIPGTTAAFTASGYLDFLLTTTFILVVIFQLPLIIIAAVGTKLLNPTQITENRPYVYVGAITIAAIVTPTTDILTLGLVAAPAIVAVEVGVGVARLIFRTKQV